MKEILKNIILEFHKDELPPLFKRSYKIESLPINIRKAMVFIGMRRVGKTFLMYQHMKDLLESGLSKNKLLYINFEDDRLENFKIDDFQTILDVYFELYPNNTKSTDLYFYFDEIQNIHGWEKFIRRLLDKEKMHIFITGSSAKFLSKEIATSLRGRCIKTEIFPMSFKEYLIHQNITNFQNITSKEKSVIKHYCQTYLKQGGFPETLSLSDSLHNQTIQSYVNAAVFRDVIDRYQLKNPHIVKLFLLQCLQNIASILSITKVYNTLKSRGETLNRNNLYDYLEYFEDAYIIFTVPVFELSTRKRQVNPNKIYCIDSAIINSYSIKPQMELSSCLENAVYLHLRNLNFEHIYYYKTSSGKEIDFIAQQKTGSIQLFQVCLNMTDEKTKKREISAIIEAASELKINEAFIISYDEQEIIRINDTTINVIPFWRWSLESKKNEIEMI